MKRYGNWECIAWVKKALIALKYLKSCHGDDKGLDPEMLQRIKLGPVGGNYQEADFSPILEHFNNFCSSLVDGAALRVVISPSGGF